MDDRILRTGVPAAALGAMRQFSGRLHSLWVEAARTGCHGVTATGSACDSRGWSASAESSRFVRSFLARGKRRGEGAMHAGHIGVDAGKQPECLRRLVYAHSAAAEHTCPFGGSGFDEFRSDRRIDDVSSPVRRFKRKCRHRITGKAAHTDLCRVDHPLGSRDVTFKISRDAAARCAVMLRKISIERIRARAIAIVK
jgi:hypothetical protein